MNADDYKALIKFLYFPKKPEIIKVPPLLYAMIDGQGDPNTSQTFQDAVGALYAISYGIKMLPKKGIVPDRYFEYKVNALEGLWTMPEGTAFDGTNKDAFVWTLMIQQPPFVTQELFDAVRKEQLKKKGNEALNRVRLETLNEGLCCQTLHIGAFDDEPITFSKMHDFIDVQGYKRTSKQHHEIYMSDFRRVAAEKCKTILRFGVVAQD